jgi:hypothetical protein
LASHGIWLNLTDLQYEALGGLPVQPAAPIAADMPLKAEADSEGRIQEL